MSDPTKPSQHRQGSSGGRRKWMTGMFMAAAFVAGGLTVSTVSAMADDAGMHDMMGGGRHDHMEAMAHMSAALDAVGATADQKTRIETILHGGLKPLMDVHGDMHGLHRDLVKLLSAPTIDRGALEQLRLAEMGKLDQATRGAFQAIADAAEVLSADQRAKLADVVAKHHPAG